MSIVKALDSATSALARLGISLRAEPEAPIIAVISQVASIAPEEASAIARTLQHSSAFNQLVREEIGQMKIADRYESITKHFDSIRDDARAMVGYVEDGKLDWKERVAMLWMRIVRGSIPERFDRIRETYLEVAKDCRDQIQRESTILFAYREFRLAFKASEVAAERLLARASEALEQARRALATAQEAVDAGDREAGAAYVELELVRDRAMHALQNEDRRYQIAKDLSDNIKAGYAAGEVVMARLLQSTSIKERVYHQAVTFFSTNETVFTALAAAFTSLQGLHEGTRALEEMKAGMNKGMESLADVGSQVQLEGLRAGYGPGLAVDSVRRLVEAVVDFQRRSYEIIDEMRAQATRNADEIAETVALGKKQLNQLALTRHTSEPTPVALPGA